MSRNVSPSAQKVDDFLSKISQLSQDRLWENQKTQRSLQLEIDALRSSQNQNHTHSNSRIPGDFGISQLSFNRSARSQPTKYEPGAPPAMPTRPKTDHFGRDIADSSPSMKFSDESNRHANYYSSSSAPEMVPDLPQRPKIFGQSAQPDNSQKSSNTTSFRLPKTPERPKKPASLTLSAEKEKRNTDAEPAYPKRPSSHNEAFSGLLRPVSRRDAKVNQPMGQSPVQIVNTKFVASRPKSDIANKLPKKPTSFSDMENRIKEKGNTAADSLTTKSSPTDFESKAWKVRSEVDHEAASKVGTISESRSDSKIDNISKPREPTATNSNRAFSLKPSKPAKPVKFSLKAFETDNTELLKSQISRLSPIKSTRDDKFGTQKQKDPEMELNPKKSAFGVAEVEKPQGLKPLKPPKPKAFAHEPEAVLARDNLRKSRPKEIVTEAVPEALRKFQSLKSGQQKKDKHSINQPTSEKSPNNNTPQPQVQKANILETPKTTRNASQASPINKQHISVSKPESIETRSSGSNSGTIAKPDFHAHLASIIRASTDPSMGNPAAGIEPSGTLQRAHTVPEKESSKLTHPNKARAKGPKRKLPKSGATSQVPQGNNQENKVTKKNLEGKICHLYASEQSQSEEKDKSLVDLPKTNERKIQPLVFNKPKKVPPPIAKKPNFDVKPRKISGELFI